jgi:hypothetical protein
MTNTVQRKEPEKLHLEEFCKSCTNNEGLTSRANADLCIQHRSSHWNKQMPRVVFPGEIRLCCFMYLEENMYELHVAECFLRT